MCLPTKQEALSSNPSTTTKEKKKEILNASGDGKLIARNSHTMVPLYTTFFLSPPGHPHFFPLFICDMNSNPFYSSLPALEPVLFCFCLFLRGRKHTIGFGKKHFNYRIKCTSFFLFFDELCPSDYVDYVDQLLVEMKTNLWGFFGSITVIRL
jgi:hypothetical protein